MFSKRPGQIRQSDEDGEDDPPVQPAPARLPLTNENGEELTNENGEALLV